MNRAAAARLIQFARLDQPWPGAPPEDEWPALIQLAQRAGVQSLLATRALRHPDSLPEAIRQNFESLRRREARQHGYFLTEAERVTHALTDRSIPSVLLKGVGISHTVYDDPNERGFRDLDLLVDAHRIDDATACLEALGYPLLTGGALLGVYRRHHFHLIFGGSHRPRLELHWALTRPGEYCSFDAGRVLERSEPMSGSRLRIPCTEDQLLHGALNLLRGGFTELKRVVDIDRLLRSKPDLDWKPLARLAQDSGLAPALRLSVELAAEFLATPLGAAFEHLGEIPTSQERKLRNFGIDRFPFRLPPSQWPFAPQLVRSWLTDPPGLPLLAVARRSPFERARLGALEVSRVKQTLTCAKRVARILLLQLRVLALGLRRHRFTPLLTGVACQPSSAPLGADRADTREPAS